MATESQIRANQQNAQRSTGPKTEQGKEHSRTNALKHGLTGAGIVLPLADAVEVERRAVAFARELDARGEVENALSRRAALNSVRMERGADQQTAAMAARIRLVETNFVAPEGVDAAEAAKLKAETIARAMFDPSREATLARQYEAAAERGFLRAIRELRQLQKQAKRLDPAVQDEVFRQELASILAQSGAMNEEFDYLYARQVAEDPSLADALPSRLASVPPSSRLQPAGGSFDVPFAIGRAR